MIHVVNLSVQAGDFAMRGIDFQVPDGAYGILMGATGSGKTTILETIAGLKPATGGTIELAGVDVTGLRASQRGIGYVPQDGALFNTMTVGNHLSFALRIRKWSDAQMAQRVNELAELLGIAALLDRKPHGLSGGERQRVALGRALSFRPRILLLDEPLSALDEQTKAQMYDLLKRVQRHERVTALHVTHFTDEARQLGDCVLRVRDGSVLEESLTARKASEHEDSY